MPIQTLTAKTNADNSTWTFSSSASMPVAVYVADISAVWIKSDATQIFLSYYPATENHPAIR